MNSEALYVHLAEEEINAFALLADKALPVEAFAQKYTGLIQEHYRARGLERDQDTAYAEAVRLHGYLLGEPED